jgi:hypothetical protein
MSHDTPFQEHSTTLGEIRLQVFVAPADILNRYVNTVGRFKVSVNGLAILVEHSGPEKDISVYKWYIFQAQQSHPPQLPVLDCQSLPRVIKCIVAEQKGVYDLVNGTTLELDDSLSGSTEECGRRTIVS